MAGIVQHLDIAADTQEQLALAIQLVLVWHGSVESYMQGSLDKEPLVSRSDSDICSISWSGGYKKPDLPCLTFFRFAKPEHKSFPGGGKINSPALLARWIYAWLRDDVDEGTWRRCRSGCDGDVHQQQGWRIRSYAAESSAFYIVPEWIEYHK